MGKLHGEAKFFSRDGMMEKVEYFMNGVKMTTGDGTLLENGNTRMKDFFLPSSQNRNHTSSQWQCQDNFSFL